MNIHNHIFDPLQIIVSVPIGFLQKQIQITVISQDPSWLNAHQMSSQEIKVQQSSSSKPQKKKTGRPRKNPQISYQASLSSSNVSVKSKHSSKVNKQSIAKIEQDLKSIKQKEMEQEELKAFEPNEKQLCQALLIIKSKLPNRSLQRIIIKLHQVLLGQKIVANTTIFQQNNLTDNMSLIQPEKNDQPSQKYDQMMSTVTQPQQQIKQQQIKQSQPENWQKISQIIANKKAPKIQQQIEVSEQYSNGKNVILNFKAQNSKKVYYNPQEQSKYNERRKIARIFIQRGFAVTKKIDRQLPQIDIQRNHFRNLMGGVLTHAFRTLESFLVNKCQRTITILDQSQMKSIIFILLHCRFKLEPDKSDTFLKFLTVAYSLNDTTITQNQAVALYVGVMKYLFGKNITMEICQNKGRIRNMRENKKPQVPNGGQIMCKINKTNKGSNAKSVNKSVSNQSQSQCKDEYLWTPQLQQQFARLYISSRKIPKIREEMVNRHLQLEYLTVAHFQSKLNELLVKGMRRIKQDCIKGMKNDPFSKNSQKDVIEFQKGNDLGEQIKSFILAYLFSNQPTRFILLGIRLVRARDWNHFKVQKIQTEMREMIHDGLIFCDKLYLY